MERASSVYALMTARCPYTGAECVAPNDCDGISITVSRETAESCQESNLEVIYPNPNCRVDNEGNADRLDRNLATVQVCEMALRDPEVNARVMDLIAEEATLL